MKEVLAEYEEGELRGRLMTVCLNSIPNKMDFVEGMILISILSQIGIVDLRDADLHTIDLTTTETSNIIDSIDMSHTYEMDDNGRITRLNVGTTWAGEDDFVMPAGIGRLQRLTHLEVSNCGSLPAKELSKLQYLQTLHFYQSFDILENFPAQMELKFLKELSVFYSDFQTSSPFLAWMVKQLPSLERLTLWRVASLKEENGTDCILNALCTNNDVCFQDSLKRLLIRCGELDDSHLETLLRKVLPRFPNMRCLNLFQNNIKSIQPFVDRMKNDNTSPVLAKSIRCLDLSGNPITNKLEDDPEEKAAMLSFLQTFNTICDLGLKPRRTYDIDSDIVYALRINEAGRSIVEGNFNNSNGGDGGDGRQQRSSLPLSAWPTVLKKAYENKENDPTGLFYLLREGPALAGRCDLNLITNNNNNNNNNDKLDNDDDYNGGVTNNNTSIKTKN